MTKLINRIAAAGALLLLNGAVAFAQSEMKLDVPFAFQTPTTQMPAGKYYITELSSLRSAPFYRIQHAETGKATVVVAPEAVSRKNNINGLKAQVAFRCANDVCAISEIFPMSSTYGHKVPTHFIKALKSQQVATITLPAAAE